MIPDLATAAQAYKILLQEETHLNLSISGGSNNESMPCKVEKRKYQERDGNRNYNSEGRKNKKLSLWYDHCRMSGHVKEKCWKNVG